jgi:hypothetical protein
MISVLGVPASEQNRQTDKKDPDAHVDDKVVHVQLLCLCSAVITNRMLMERLIDLFAQPSI